GPVDDTAARFAKLHEQGTDAAGGGLDEHVVAGVQPNHLLGAIVCRAALSRQRRRDGGVHIVRNRNDGARVGHGGRGIAAKARQRCHALPGLQPAYPGPEAIDAADDIVADDTRYRWGILVRALPRRNVGVVETESLDGDAHLSRIWFRVGLLAELEGF